MKTTDFTLASDESRDHPLVDQRVRITAGPLESVGEIGVLRLIKITEAGDKWHLVWTGGRGFWAAGIEPVVSDELADLCDTITTAADRAYRRMRAGSGIGGPMPKQSRVAAEAAIMFLVQNPGHAERIARYANEASKQTIQLGSH